MNGQLPAELKFKENTDHFPRPPLDLPFTFVLSILEAQGANLKEVSFTACHLGKLYLACTSLRRWQNRWLTPLAKPRLDWIGSFPVTLSLTFCHLVSYRSWSDMVESRSFRCLILSNFEQIM